MQSAVRLSLAFAVLTVSFLAYPGTAFAQTLSSLQFVTNGNAVALATNGRATAAMRTGRHWAGTGNRYRGPVHQRLH